MSLLHQLVKIFVYDTNRVLLAQLDVYLVFQLFYLVGYIVGLGDRHVQNILIDCHTAELVHIDLGEKMS